MDLNNFRRELEQLFEGVAPGSAEARTLQSRVLEVLDAVLAAHSAALPPLAQICSEELRLLVVDEKSGRLFQRLLPVKFQETSTGITLTGEDYAANPAQIAFLSETGLLRIRELCGEGSDHPRCQ